MLDTQDRRIRSSGRDNHVPLGHAAIDHDLREKGEIQLTSSLEMLRSQERYVAVETVGERYDMGVPFGYVETQAALALNGVDRTEMLAALLRIVAKSAAQEPFGQV